MYYALLIYESDAVTNGYTDDELEDALNGHRAFQAKAKADGVFIEANQLMPPGTATSVRVRANTPRVTDGPFAETKELLIGYYVLDCPSLDDAITYAAQIPHASTGGIEVRPVTYLERHVASKLTWTT